MNNEMYLRKSRKWFIEPGSHVLPQTYLAAVMKNVESLGFTFSQALMKALSTLSVEELDCFSKQLVHQLKLLVGANVVYKPMYPGFPEQVMQAEEAELYVNAILHYITGIRLDQTTADRPLFLERVELKVIDLGSKKDFYRMVRNMFQAKSSVSQADKDDMEWIIAMEDDLSAVLPDEIPLKENVGFVVAMLLRYEKADAKQIRPYVKTATDVLRLAAALSDGDVSLAANTRFRKFKRAERRLLLALLEQCGGIVEDMLRYKERWIRLGEILHPAEYKNRYAKCREAFDILRNNLPFETFGSRVELALRWKNTALAAEVLAERPGEYARRLDHLVRTHKEPKQVVEQFRGLVSGVSTPVVLQVMTHFSRRNEKREWRTFFPKGNVAKAVAIPNTLPAVKSGICMAIVNACRESLLDRFAAMPSLGKVYIDKRLKDHIVPFSQRSASKALRTIVRGSRLAMPQSDNDTIRFFLWWKEGEVNGNPTGRVDIDLSAIMYDDQWRYMEHISYTNLRSAKYKAAHSGDIVSAPEGACEFIDMDIPSAVRYGARYIVLSLNSFTSQPYCDLPECYAGWMMRKSPGSGEVFEPAAVVDKVDLAADTQIAIPVILDLSDRNVIWCDLALTRHPAYNNNVEGNQTGLSLMGQAMESMVKPNLYDLFMLHALARGELVESAGEADTVFSLEAGITPFDISTIMAEYIA
jgi:hypothetical protein